MMMSRMLCCALLAVGCVDETIEPENEVEEGVPYSVPGLQWTYKTSETSTQWWRSPDLDCPAGTTVFGTGVAQTQSQNLLFRGTVINGRLWRDWTVLDVRGVTSATHEDSIGTSIQWQTTAYAICGPKLDEDQVVRYVHYPATSDNVRVASVRCRGAERLVGGGGTILGGDQRVKIDEIRPSADLTSIAVYASEDQLGTTGAWQVRAFAVCAKPPAGLVRVATSVPNGWDGREVIAECPAGKRLLASGGGVEANTTKYTRVFQIIPSVNLKYTIVRVSAGVTVPGNLGQVNAYAICADE